MKRLIVLLLVAVAASAAFAGGQKLSAMGATDGTTVPALNPHSDFGNPAEPVAYAPAGEAQNLTWSYGVPYTLGVSRLAAVVAGNKLHIVTGELEGGGRAAQYVFNFATQTWSTGLSHPGGGISNADAAAVSDTLIIVGGGYDLNGAMYESVTKLDLTANTWTAGVAMPVAGLLYYAACASGGDAYFFGGVVNQSTVSNGAYRYNVATNDFTTLATMPLALRSQAAVAIGDTIYLLGGGTAAGTPYNGTTNFLKYSISGNSWTTGTAMGFSAMWGRAVPYNDPADGWVIYYFGGYNGSGAVTTAVWAYTVSTGTWMQCNSLAGLRRSHGGAIYRDTVLAVCGYSGSGFVATVERGAIAQSGVIDVGVSSITAPAGSVPPSTTLTPAGVVRNFGTLAASSIPVHCRIDSAGTQVYTSTATLAGPLAPGATAPVTFSPDWTIGMAGTEYTVRMWTTLTGDANHANDTMTGSARASNQRIFRLLHSDDGPPTTLGGILRALGDSIEYLDVRYTTPVLGDLTPYSAVMVFDNYAFPDPAALGNVLADYVDLDGGVTICQGALATGWAVEGRIMTGDYATLVPGALSVSATTLGWHNTAHPLMTDVTAVGDKFIAACGLAAGAESVANWADGRRYAAASVNEKVVGLNQFPAEFVYPERTGDWGLVIHNALWYTSGGLSGVEGFDPLRPALNVRLDAAPSPSARQVTVSYAVAGGTPVTVGIYDLGGRLVKTLYAGTARAGLSSLVWNLTDGAGRQVASGTYFCRLVSGGTTEARKIVVQ